VSGTITALKAQKRNNQRVNIFLDGEFAFGLSRITAAWLAVGQELSDEKIAQLQHDDAREVAHQQALRLIERRERTESEIRRNLAKHEVPETTIDEVLTRLKAGGLVNDDRFANMWIENQRRFRPRSRKALAFEMRQRGVESEAIEQALEKISIEDEEEMAEKAARAYVRKNGHRLRNQEWQSFRTKLGSYLTRRGFPYSICGPIIQQAWDSLQQEAHSSEID
jgi:regulatory protein